jgi:hypothetical protein
MQGIPTAQNLCDVWKVKLTIPVIISRKRRGGERRGSSKRETRAWGMAKVV